MGVIIFTRDPVPYREGNYIEEYRGMTTAPTAPETTFIVHDAKFTEKEATQWVDLVPYRLVIVTDKMTIRGKDERIFSDRTMSIRTQSFRRNVEAVFRWTDRDRVFKTMGVTPLPLVASFVRVNRQDDIDTARRLGLARYVLPDEYLHATLAFSIRATAGPVTWPKKRSTKENEPLPFSRTSDVYADNLVDLAPEIRNDLREKYADSLPSRLKKGKEGVTEWI